MLRKLLRIIIISAILVVVLCIGIWYQPEKPSLAVTANQQTHKNVLIATPGHSIIPLSDMKITAIAPVTSKDIWITGTYANNPGQSQIFYEHFDGSQWYEIAAPTVESPCNINSISIVSKNDIWAVGDYPTKDYYGHAAPAPLIEHWDGSQWSQVDANSNLLGSFKAVTASSANDIWAVGASYNPGVDHHFGYISWEGAMIEHFDGSKWQIVPNPASNANHALSSITTIAANDIWAVGIVDNEYGAYYFDEGYSTLTEHFDGTQWSVIPGENLGYNEYYTYNYTSLVSVSAINTHDMWAVGKFGNQDKYAISEHWDGTHWSLVSVQNTPPAPLTSVMALHSRDIWATGNGAVFHWNGTFWETITHPAFLNQLIVWQRLEKTNTLIGIGIINNETRLITLTSN